jgi:hypothetical protein
MATPGQGSGNDQRHPLYTPTSQVLQIESKMLTASRYHPDGRRAGDNLSSASLCKAIFLKSSKLLLHINSLIRRNRIYRSAVEFIILLLGGRTGYAEKLKTQG